MTKTAGELLSDYWDHAADRGEKRRPAYAVVERYSTTNANPDGFLHTWSLHKREASRYRDQFPRLLRLVKIVALD